MPGTPSALDVSRVSNRHPFSEAYFLYISKISEAKIQASSPPVPALTSSTAPLSSSSSTGTRYPIKFRSSPINLSSASARSSKASSSISWSSSLPDVARMLALSMSSSEAALQASGPASSEMSISESAMRALASRSSRTIAAAASSFATRIERATMSTGPPPFSSSSSSSPASPLRTRIPSSYSAKRELTLAIDFPSIRGLY
mmetsp:Transcript_23522/g.56971  ORF Transcript_23522/g.56971 Transcript_23522/m.56971 type:complete len:202 (+) Transcript_23522:994-1599(+)